MSNSRFTKASFLSASNIYEVNIRQYTPEGTFSAFAKHLPRLKEMGVEILWLMPVHPIGVQHRKGTLGSYYAISDYLAINEYFGTKEDFKNLIDYAHHLGIKVLMDWVANHTAWDHVWTKTNPEYFLKNEQNNFVSPFDWEDVIQINHTNTTQQSAMINAMEYWITDFNIDGFRADMAHLTPLAFWSQARTFLTTIKKDLVWLAETEDLLYSQIFDISYTWEWMHASEKMCKQEISLVDAVKVLTSYNDIFAEDHLRLFFTSNHDENSWTGTEYQKYGVFTKAMAVFSFLYKSVPLIYSGQELPCLKQLAFFEKDEIPWTNEIALHSFYKTLLDVRKRNVEIFSTGKIIFDEIAVTNNILCYKIYTDTNEIIICLNFRNEPCQYEIKNLKGRYRDVFSHREMWLDSSYQFNVAAGKYLVLESY